MIVAHAGRVGQCAFHCPYRDQESSFTEGIVFRQDRWFRYTPARKTRASVTQPTLVFSTSADMIETRERVYGRVIAVQIRLVSIRVTKSVSPYSTGALTR